MTHGELETKSFRYVGKSQPLDVLLREQMRKRVEVKRQAEQQRQAKEVKSRRAKMRNRNR